MKKSLATALLIAFLAPALANASCRPNENGGKTCCIPTHVGGFCCDYDKDGNKTGCRNDNFENSIVTTLSRLARESAPTFHCEGAEETSPVVLDFYQGYGYDATYSYAKDGTVLSSGYAHGGSFTECGSRAVPCALVTITQYDVKDLSLIFTMSGPAEAQTRTASVSIYGDGYENPATEEISLTCEIGN